MGQQLAVAVEVLQHRPGMAGSAGGQPSLQGAGSSRGLISPPPESPWHSVCEAD